MVHFCTWIIIAGEKSNDMLGAGQRRMGECDRVEWFLLLSKRERNQSIIDQMILENACQFSKEGCKGSLPV